VCSCRSAERHINATSSCCNSSSLLGTTVSKGCGCCLERSCYSLTMLIACVLRHTLCSVPTTILVIFLQHYSVPVNNSTLLHCLYCSHLVLCSYHHVGDVVTLHNLLCRTAWLAALVVAARARAAFDYLLSIPAGTLCTCDGRCQLLRFYTSVFVYRDKETIRLAN
jgi:hypothetical protein